MAAWSVVIPTNRLHPRLEALVRDLLNSSQEPPEIWLVCDTCDASVRQGLDEIRSAHRPGWVHIVTLTANHGQHAAILAGLSLTRSPRVLTVDDDGKYPVEDVLRLMERANGLPADRPWTVYGLIRHAGGVERTKRVLLHAIKWCSNQRHPVPHEGSSLRAFPRPVVQHLTTHRVAWPFIDAQQLDIVDHFEFVPVSCVPTERTGTTSYRPGEKMLVMARAIAAYTWLPECAVAVGVVTLLVGTFSHSNWWLLLLVPILLIAWTAHRGRHRSMSSYELLIESVE